jgi:hypothetical protein
MNEKQEAVEITGVFSKYWDNSKTRNEGKNAPDRIVMKVKGTEVEIAVFSKKWKGALRKPALIASFKEGDTVTLPILRQVSEENIARYRFNWENQEEEGSEPKPFDHSNTPISGPFNLVKGGIEPTTIDKEGYWAKRSEGEAKTQARIASQWAVNAAIETLKLAASPDGYGEHSPDELIKAIEVAAEKLLSASTRLSAKVGQ